MNHEIFVNLVWDNEAGFHACCLLMFMVKSRRFPAVKIVCLPNLWRKNGRNHWNQVFPGIFLKTQRVPIGGPCKVHAEGKAGPQQGGATSRVHRDDATEQGGFGPANRAF